MSTQWPTIRFNGFENLPADIVSKTEKARTGIFDFFPDDTTGNLERVIEVVPSQDGLPWTLNPRQKGCERIFIAAELKFPCQFAYQMSHELGHVCANHLHPDANRWQWLEEAIVEALAYLNMKINVDSSYAELLRRDDYSDGSLNPPLSGWYAERSAQLERNRCVSSFNRPLVLYFARLIEADKVGRAAIRYLNSWNGAGGASDLVAHLQAWKSACPNDGQGFVHALANAFEIRL